MSGVTSRFLLEVATIQLSSWRVSSLFPSLACNISMFISFVSVFSCSSLIGCLLVKPIALFIKYGSPLLIILIDGICMFPCFGDGRLFCLFLFPLAALSLEHCLIRPFRSAAQAELKRNICKDI